jgi:hypothetical protein
LFGCFLLGGFFLALTYKFIKRDIEVDLNKTDFITGNVESCGVTVKKSRSMKNLVFFVRLNNSDQYFGAYRAKQDYSKLIDEINIGDIVTIYYRRVEAGDLNLNVYQIEKSGHVLLDYHSYESLYYKMAWFMGLLGSSIILIGVWRFYSAS